MLSIRNINWKYNKFTRTVDLVNLLNKKMKDIVKVHTTIQVVNDDLVFVDVEKNRTFMSLVKNKINIPNNSQRSKELQKTKGRDYLESYRPTEKQFISFFETIQTVLNELGLSAIVEHTDQRTGKVLILRQGNLIVNVLPEVRSFTKEIV